jgi:hypothetical protein
MDVGCLWKCCTSVHFVWEGHQGRCCKRRARGTRTSELTSVLDLTSCLSSGNHKHICWNLSAVHYCIHLSSILQNMTPNTSRSGITYTSEVWGGKKAFQGSIVFVSSTRGQKIGSASEHPVPNTPRHNYQCDNECYLFCFFRGHLQTLPG